MDNKTLYNLSPFISPISPTILISADTALATLAFLLFLRYLSTLPNEECLSQRPRSYLFEMKTSNEIACLISMGE